MAGGLNTYAYVEGNPINKIDPNGLNALWTGRAGWAIGGGLNSLAYHATGITLSTMLANAAWNMFGDDGVYSDPYGGYDPVDENDALDLANNPAGASCAAIQEAIVALQNRIRGREANAAEHCGGDAGHRQRIQKLKDALAKLQKALSSCR